MQLSKREAAYMEAAGTELRLVPRDKWENNRPGFRRNFYELASNCGNLVVDPEGDKAPYCGDYYNRPDICAALPAGGGDCNRLRVQQSMRLPEGAIALPIEPK